MSLLDAAETSGFAKPGPPHLAVHPNWASGLRCAPCWCSTLASAISQQAAVSPCVDSKACAAPFEHLQSARGTRC